MALWTLKPLHGWRAFFGEVGVVVLGVLLALAAQQIAQDIQMASEVREFRRTIDHEIALNLYAYQVRTRGGACNAKRIQDLSDWVKNARDGQVLPQIAPAPPTALTPYRSAWDTRNGEVFSHVPAKARQKYAEFYDELESNTQIIKRELELWLSLERYALPAPVSDDDRRAIIGALRTDRVLNIVWDGNMQISRRIADEINVKPIRPDNFPEDYLKDVDTCRPIFVKSGASAGSPKS